MSIPGLEFIKYASIGARILGVLAALRKGGSSSNAMDVALRKILALLAKMVGFTYDANADVDTLQANLASFLQTRGVYDDVSKTTAQVLGKLKTAKAEGWSADRLLSEVASTLPGVGDVAELVSSAHDIADVFGSTIKSNFDEGSRSGLDGLQEVDV